MWEDGRQMPWSETPTKNGESRQAAALADLFQSARALFCAPLT